ncbi:type IV fimbrial biogenesis protein FimT [Pelomonas saccharophila]|uniref:Type II secretion system protein H n=1 Tax=Roseateles saccharophilus TaxID=304 RepID=A0ABU1YJI2_ROSSA|nr:GspH/FimT family pseudopilin [Roseateles saccharophilus]MDR7269013.1 type IV fimbrial biogenesis protein FimT [Roseateles saccharophilus]
MLNPMRQRGVTLIELVVAVVIMGVMMAMAAPSFGTWITGTRIRSTAESMLAGLQYARSEATTRNTQVRFQLTTSLDATCALSTSSANWLVDVVTTDANDSVETRCNATPSDTVAPTILQVRAAAETGSGIVVAAGSSQIIFNGLGRQVPIAPATAAANVSIDITPATTRGTCVASGGKVTCLRIVINPGGLVRMCNPAAASSDPQAC